jgi:hypothetical protein
MLLPYSKRLVPHSWNTSNGISHTKRQARVELNFLDYSDSKRYYSEPEAVRGKRAASRKHGLILGTQP